jgi:glutaredoxin/uncharacterized membrane protein YhaH (DUF805 family)
MEELSQLVFFGEILPGHDADAVKAKLAELLKLPAEQIGSVFSGRKVVLRKSLPTEQAAAYVTRLEKIGVKVFAEPLAAVASPAVIPAPPKVSAPVPQASTVAPAIAPVAAEATQFAESPAPVALAIQTPPVGEMDCPKCGERQPKRTLCRACSVDMKRFAESQQQVEQEVREERMMAREIALAERSGRGRGRVNVDSDEEAKIFGLGFSGRIGRVNCWVACFPIWTLIALSMWLAAKLNTWPIFFIGLAATLFFSFRICILRCHDINWSGWFSLILCIPYVGALFGLVLSFMPGSKEDNNYGSPSRMVSFPAALGMAVVCGISFALLFSEAGNVYQAYAARTHAMQSKSSDKAVLSVADADVEMFTTSDCGVCHMAKAYMDKRGITYAEKDVERNEEYLRDFYARGGRGVPYIFVGNQSMSGFDPGRLEQMLANQR